MISLDYALVALILSLMFSCAARVRLQKQRTRRNRRRGDPK